VSLSRIEDPAAESVIMHLVRWKTTKLGGFLTVH